MTRLPSAELLILAYEALEERPSHQGWISDFPRFQADWTATRMEDRGLHTLSVWRGLQTEAMVLLTEGQPAERTLVSVDYRPHARRAALEAREGTFLQPGIPLRWQNDRLASFGIFAGWWPCEPAAKRLRLTRRGDVSEIEATSEGFTLIDWDSPAPVDRFDAVWIDGEGWMPTVLSAIPYTGKHLLDSYRRFRFSGVEQHEQNPDLWAYDLFSISGDAWFDAVVALLRHADPDRDFELLSSFGAHIYANGHAYYDRMERELEAGTIDREVLGIVLSMEKPEFMDEDLRIRHLRFAARCS